MKILHIITSLQTGGAEMLVVNLMPRFRALEHEVGVVVFNGEQTPLMERLERECPECRIYRLGTGYYNPWYIVRLISIMRKYDIVHTHNSSPQLFAAIANIVCRKKLVTTEHNTYNRKRDSWLMCTIDRWMYPRYDKVICISDQTEKNLRRFLNENEGRRTKDEASNIMTIYNGVEIDAYHHAMPIENLKSEKFVAVMVAAFRPQKDQDTLIRAMSLLPKDEYEVWLVGDGPRRKSLELRVESLEMEDSVRFLGLRTDVPNILKTADVVVMSSHWEGFGLTAVEGMAAKRPVIGSAVDGLRQIVEDFGLIFPHEDAEALAAIIRRLHDDREFYNQVALRCYERAQQYDISQMVERYNRVYIG